MKGNISNTSTEIKKCCTQFYENDFLINILGGYCHPGGKELTIHLGNILDLNKNHIVLDIASGIGSSAISLSKHFNCKVIGIDLSGKNVKRAQKKATLENVSDYVSFNKSDVEKIQYDDETFDIVICECSLCLFPDKIRAIKEIYRVLKINGKVGIADVILNGNLPNDLNNIFQYVLCISGAQSPKDYQRILSQNGFLDIRFEDCSYVLTDLTRKIKKIASSLEILSKSCECNIEKTLGIPIDNILNLTMKGVNEVEKGTIGYGLFTAVKS